MASYKAPRGQVQASCAHWPGLSGEAAHYRVILCDLWGVVHNGVRLYEAAVEALVRYRGDGDGSGTADGGRQVVLMSNAPRPSAKVREQLARLGLDERAYDEIVTSGDLTQEALVDGVYGGSCHHIGPARDLGLFEGARVERVGCERADFILCTGFDDDEAQTPQDYRPRLEACLARDLIFVCANPDLIVERDGRLIPCAGQLAEFYQGLGGRVVYFGKPHDPIYHKARALIGAEDMESEEILVIGDGLQTDIAGAQRQGFHALLITSGISRDIGGDAVAEACRRAGVMPQGWMSALAWSAISDYK